MSSLSLKAKLLTAGLGVAVVPLAIVVVFLYFQTDEISGLAREAIVEQGHQQMEKEIAGILDTVEITKALLEQDVEKLLNLASDRLDQLGGLQLSEQDSVEWQAVNQYTGARQTIELPVARIGEAIALERQDSFAHQVPLVDRIGELTGDTATLFQRMNEAGDMLRIATNVRKDGQRAVGTFIPATNPSGRDSTPARSTGEQADWRDRLYLHSQYQTGRCRHLCEMQSSTASISQVIGTIDNIAFQTNILKGGAMNASVVSLLDEVKDKAGSVDAALAHIDASVGRAHGAMHEMDAGAKQQKEGIEQVTLALQQVNEVTQQTAVNAEQAASASEELSAQANRLRQVVGRLNRLIQGGIIRGES
ncbi:MAG: Cache 3/Cache 2 fusion domain-containing protein [Halochromatium sp.]|uniref:Cache 3/Cache 2 fusion domain-containing protein n=1 Tax=Halochromatium sp. TaxID=2049430 RepID=UPI00397CACC1